MINLSFIYCVCKWINWAAEAHWTVKFDVRHLVAMSHFKRFSCWNPENLKWVRMNGHYRLIDPRNSCRLQVINHFRGSISLHEGHQNQNIGRIDDWLTIWNVPRTMPATLWTWSTWNYSMLYLLSWYSVFHFARYSGRRLDWRVIFQLPNVEQWTAIYLK